jgi:hypothetical protein
LFGDCPNFFLGTTKGVKKLGGHVKIYECTGTDKFRKTQDKQIKLQKQLVNTQSVTIGLILESLWSGLLPFFVQPVFYQGEENKNLP